MAYDDGLDSPESVMTLKIPIWLLVLVALSLPVPALWWLRNGRGFISGSVSESPDGKYIAELVSISERYLCAPNRSYYAFGVYRDWHQPTGGPRADRLFRVIQIPVENETALKRVRGSMPFDVHWSSDNRTVSCKIDDVQITVDVVDNLMSQ